MFKGNIYDQHIAQSSQKNKNDQTLCPVFKPCIDGLPKAG